MEEIRGEGSEQLSNILCVNTKQELHLSKGDKANRIRCSFVKITDIVSLHLLSICATLKDAEEEECDPFRPTGSETMEKPKNPKTGKKRVSDVIDSLPGTNGHRTVSTPEMIISTREPDSSVSLGYGSIDSGTPNSSVSPASDASPMSQDNAMSSR